MRTLREHLDGARAAPRARPMRRCRSSPSTICSPMVKAGFSERHRLLEDHRDARCRAGRCSSRVARPTQLAALEADRAAGDAARRLRHQAHDRQRGDALAAARFADDRERAAGLDRRSSTPSTAANSPASVAKAVRRSRTSSRARIDRRRAAAGAARAAWKRSMRASISRAVGHAGRVVAARQAGDEGLEALEALRVQAAQLGDRLGVVVDAQVELGIVLVAVDAQRRGLLAALVAAGRFAGAHRARAGARRAAGRRWRDRPRRSPRDLRAGEHVAGDAEVVADAMAAPVDAVARRCAPRRGRRAAEHVQLALRAAGVGAGQRRDDLVGARAPAASSSSAGRRRTAGSSAPASRARRRRAACARTARRRRRSGSRSRRRSGRRRRGRGSTRSWRKCAACDGRAPCGHARGRGGIGGVVRRSRAGVFRRWRANVFRRSRGGAVNGSGLGGRAAAHARDQLVGDVFGRTGDAGRMRR